MDTRVIDGARHRLKLFVDAPGDYINPLGVAYGGIDVYERAMSAFKQDIRTLLITIAALTPLPEESQDADRADHR